MAVPPDHGFPPVQPSRNPGSDGGTTAGTAGGVSDEMMRREQEYQESLAKRNKLLLDPNPVRAMDALREATRKAMEEEKKFGQAVRERMGMAGRGGTGVGLGTGFAGGGMPPQLINPPGNAREAAGGAMDRSHAAAQPGGFAGVSAVAGGVGQTIGRVVHGVNAGMNATDAATAPFVDRNTRFFNTMDSLDPTGAVGALRRVQLSLQQAGSGMTREEQAREQFQITGRVQSVTVPSIAFEQQFSPEREAAARRLRSLDLPGGQVPTIPKGLPGRDTVAGEQAHREQTALLPARRATADAFRDEESSKGREESLKSIGEKITKMIRAADVQVAEFSKAADGESNASRSKIIRAQAYEKSQEALGLHRELVKNEDDVRAATTQRAQATFRRRSAELSRDDAEQGILANRESTAAGQAQRIGGMGPAERIGGQQMLQMIQEMKKNGGDLSMLPGEVWQMAGAVAPDTVRKLQEGSGESIIKQARDSGALPGKDGEEYQHDLGSVRKQADGLRDKSAAGEATELRSVLDAITEAFKSVVGRESRLREEFERFLRNNEIQSLFNSTKSAGN